MGLEQVTAGAAAAVDFERYRLRTFVDGLGAQELERRPGKTALSEIARALEANPKAVLFESAGGHPLVGNVLAGRTRVAHAFGVPPQKAVSRNPAPEAGIHRGRPRRGAGAAGGAHRRGRGPDHAAGPPP